MSESGNAGANSANSRQTSGSDRRTYWAAAVSVVAPPVMFFATGVGLLLVTNSFDPAFELGISDTLLSGILIGLVGLLAGIVVGLVARMRGADLVLPPLVGLLWLPFWLSLLSGRANMSNWNWTEWSFFGSAYQPASFWRHG